MKTGHRITGTLAATVALVVIVCAPPADGQNGTEVVQWLQYVASEIRGLKAELIAYRIEMQEQAVPALERELLELNRYQARLQSEEASIKARMEQLDNPLPAPAADADATQMEVARTALISAESQRLRTEQAELAQRQSETRERLRTARERLRSLSQKAANPQNGSPGN